MAELERFGAFERAAVLVVIPTGTGWVNEQLVQPLEYFYDGDIATVAVQYSHLPSPLAFLSESTAAADTAITLLEAVEAAALARGADGPRLYIAGESLGSFGGARAFASPGRQQTAGRRSGVGRTAGDHAPAPRGRTAPGARIDAGATGWSATVRRTSSPTGGAT